MELPFKNLKLVTNNFKDTSPLASTAFNNVLFDYVNTTTGVIHLWTTAPAVALGHRDKQLPYFNEACNFLISNGYIPYVRSAGGLAVVSDQNILNGTLIFEQPYQALSIERTYDLAAELLQQSLPTLKIAVGEITNSYCPGKFDLSVNELKIAGLAQYRHRNKTAVSFYLSVAGNQYERGSLIRKMYQLGTQTNASTPPYPDVKPECMTTLTTISTTLTMPEVITKLVNVWPNINKTPLIITNDINIKISAATKKLINRQPANLIALHTKGVFL